MSRSIRKASSDRPDYDKILLDKYESALSSLSRYGFRV